MSHGGMLEELKTWTLSKLKSALNVAITDKHGNEIEIQQKALPVVVDGRLDYGLLEPFYSPTEVDNQQIIIVDTADEDTVIQVTEALAAYVGKFIYIKNGLRFYAGQVTAVDEGADTITVDPPLDYGFTTDSFVDIGITDMAVDGSVIPVTFKLQPLPEHRWIISDVLMTIEDSSKMFDNLFGGIVALTNGIFIHQETDIHLNVGVFKKNSDFALATSLYQYTNTAGASGVYGLLVGGIFMESAGSLLLNNDTRNDIMTVTIRDDLTGLNSLRMVARGYVKTYQGVPIPPTF